MTTTTSSSRSDRSTTAAVATSLGLTRRGPATPSRGTSCKTAPMPTVVAAVLVFVCSACVLMLEILAGRLLAPYVGISLETYTSIIGTVLAGIAVGAWVGGKLADRIDPRRLIGPTVALGGLLSLFTVPVVQSFGDHVGRRRPPHHRLPHRSPPSSSPPSCSARCTRWS